MPQSAPSPRRTRRLPGDYLLGKVIDRGAFATVHLGADRRGRRVAIKRLTSDNPQAEKRFQREIKVMFALPPSDHVVRILDSGRMPDQTPFYVMEFVDGFTLGRLFSAGRRLSEQAACELMVQLCRAFRGLHTLGVTHGDIKPNNIMLERRDMTVKLLDFGLVRDAQGLLKLLEDEHMLEGSAFAEDLDFGMLMGTPEYMAPEQIADAKIADPRRRQTDTAADVFGLGVLLFQIMTGRRPWPFEPRVKTAEDYRLAARAYLDERLQSESHHLTRPTEISPALWSIINKALRRDPKRRQRDARELLQDILRYVETGAGVMGIEQPDTINAFVGTPSLLMELPPELLVAPPEEAEAPGAAKPRTKMNPETQSLIAGGALLILAAIVLLYLFSQAV